MVSFNGLSLGFWSLVLVMLNHKFAFVPMHLLFVWTPLACVFYLVYTTKEDDAFKEVVKFLFLYTMVCITFSISFGVQYVFGLKRIFLGER